MSRKRRNKTTACPNCGTALQEGFEYCPQCGQENHDLRVPFKLFAYEFVENLTHFDTKLWSTLKLILTKPGQLTKDFVEGKRARYVHPIRFYVFTSVIFFGLLTIYLDRGIAEEALDGPRQDQAEHQPGHCPSPTPALLQQVMARRARIAPATDRQDHGRQPCIRRGRFSGLVRSPGRSLTGTYRCRYGHGRRQLRIHTAVCSVSIIMFILMPFTAILLLWIFYRQRYYWEHLIFSIHIHTIFFLFFSLLLCWRLMIPCEWPGWAGPLLVLACAAYLLLSLERVYSKSWPSTLMRSLAMSIPYTIIFATLLGLGLLWGFFTL